MGLGLGLRSKIISIISYINLIKFELIKFFLSFEKASIKLALYDKVSLKLILVKNGAQIGNECDIESGLTFHNCNDFSNLVIGKNCHIGKNCFFDLRDKIIIGNNVVISMQTTFITHIDLTKSELSKIYPQSSKYLRIGNNSYIGANSTILMGVEVGENSFIAAGSVVKDNVPPFTMVGGVPAKVIKRIDVKE